MKLKTLAMIAASGLMAASFAYVVPAYAEEFSGDEEVMTQQQLALADNSSTSSGLPSDNTNNSNTLGGGPANKMGAQTSTNAANTSNAPASNAVTPNEQGTPDVASGDDDY